MNLCECDLWNVVLGAERALNEGGEGEGREGGGENDESVDLEILIN